MARRFPEGDKASRAFPDGSKTARLYPAGTKVKRNFPVEAAKEAGSSDDDFVAKCKQSDNLYALWSCRDHDVSDALNDGEAGMSDISGNDRPNIIVELASSGNWQLENSAPPTASADSFPSLAKYLSCDAHETDTNNYAALASALGAAPVSAGDVYSGFVIFYASAITNKQKLEIASFTGTAATPAGSGQDNALALYNFRYWLGNRTEVGYTDTAAGLTGRAHTTDDRSGQWWFYGFRAHAVEGESNTADVDRITAYVQEIDTSGGSNDWGTKQSSFYNSWNAYQTYSILKTGLRLGYASTETQATARWAAIGLFTGDIGVGDSGVTLKTIYESIIG